MASVEVNVLSIARVFDELSSPIERLLRNPKGKVDGDEQAITRFVLDDDFFYRVQTYVKTGMEFPDDEYSFKMVHPPTYFKSWLQEDVEYRRMCQGITTVSQHCRSSLNEAIYPIVGFSHHIAEYASSAVNIFEALLDPLRIISDHTIPFSSFEAEDARENLKGILQLLQDSSRGTSRRSTLVLKAIGIFYTTILEDEVVLRALDELLSNRVPKDADTGDWEKQKALQTIQKINNLASSSKAALAHISAMRKALADIYDALVMVETTAETMIRAISLLSDQARPERAGYGVVGTKLEKAAGTCKQVVQLAREFAKQATQT